MLTPVKSIENKDFKLFYSSGFAEKKRNVF